MLNRLIAEINPTQLTQDESIFLYHLLWGKQGVPDSFLIANQIYDFPKFPPDSKEAKILADKNLSWKFIKLTHSLCLRQCGSDNEDSHFDVYSASLIGKGASGQVAELIGVLKKSEDQRAVFKSISPRVSKMKLLHVNRQPPSETVRSKKRALEYAISSCFDDELHAKYPTDCHGQYYSNDYFLFSTLVMKNIKGECLEKILIQDFDLINTGQKYISTDMRIDTALMMAFKLELIHRRGVIHGDIKIGNVMVDFLPSPLVTIIDHDLSSYQISPAKSCGTPEYASPEVYDGLPLCKESDIYSIACTLALLFRADPMILPAAILKDKKQYEQLKLISRQRKFTNLFKGMADLSDEHQQEIQNMLHAMVAAVPSDRLSLVGVIETLAKIHLERKLQVIDESLHDAVIEAHQAAQRLRGRLFQLFNVKQSVTEFNMEGLRDQFISELNAVIGDVPEAVSEFVCMSSVGLFRGLKTKQAVMDAFDNAVMAYPANLKKLEDLHELVKNLLKTDGVKEDAQNATLLASINRKLTTVLNKQEIKKDFITIDTIAFYNSKLIRYFEKLNPFVMQYQARLTHDLANYPSISI